MIVARILSCITVAALAGMAVPAEAAPPSADQPLASAPRHVLPPTRLLRRITLALAGRPPTITELEQVLAAPVQGRHDVALDVGLALLDSDEIDSVLLRWGLEYTSTRAYDFRFDEGNFRFHGDWSHGWQACPEGTLHAGRRGFFSAFPPLWGQPWSTCDDPNGPVAQIEPWWAPGTTVEVLGEAGSGVRSVDDVDCAGVETPARWATPGCSCGPNLLYCRRPDDVFPDDHRNFGATSSRRALFEEPARLFRHLVKERKPFSDLIAGDYTLVNRGLAYVYYASGRQNPDNAFVDDTEWWRDFADDEEWRVVTIQDLHPNLLSARDYAFDPRTDPGAPVGIPAAGVLTMLGSSQSFPRERVRAARWLELLSCRDFAPPPESAEFPTYVRDPGTEGTCVHCHQLLDPVAMHFKRLHGGGGLIAGVGGFALGPADTQFGPPSTEFADRAHFVFAHDTLMTPVAEATLQAKPGAALLDFLPEDYQLFGQSGDGTIGPLGFAKVLIESGEFDRCAVRRLHRLVVGRDLTPGRDDGRIAAFVDAFVDSDRDALSLIEAFIEDPEFRHGW